jgi:hypothetical protein
VVGDAHIVGGHDAAGGGGWIGEEQGQGGAGGGVEIFQEARAVGIRERAEELSLAVGGHGLDEGHPVAGREVLEELVTPLELRMLEHPRMIWAARPGSIRFRASAMSASWEVANAAATSSGAPSDRRRRSSGEISILEMGMSSPAGSIAGGHGEWVAPRIPRPLGYNRRVSAPA